MMSAISPARWRRFLPALLAVYPLAATPAAADEPITTRFEMYGFAGSHVLSLHGRTDDSDGRYGIAMHFATKGMAAVFVNMTSSTQVSGRIVGGTAEPASFRADTQRNGVERHSRVDYGPGGKVDATTSPPLPTAAPPARVRDTVDNLTAYIRLEHQLATSGRCAMHVHVFDGRHGYDLVFSDMGQQALTPMGGQNFSGNAIACRMEHQAWPDMPDSEKDEGARQGTIWYARLVPGDLLVPVRMRMDTQFGVVEGYLAELHGRGVNLALME